MSQHSHLLNLNPEQLRAVRHGDGPLLIFAGAGSGKTRVLTSRVANLILEHKVIPEQIFAVTFTNKAAAEMKHRISAMFSGFGSRAWVSTFHASCVRILRQHAGLLDFTPEFAIYDRDDSFSALKKVYQKLNIDPKVIDPRSVLRMIDRAKNEYKTSADLKKELSISSLWSSSVPDIFDAYQEALRTSNAMDFGDLICNVVTLFKLEPKLLASYQQQFSYLMVDEYQDTNKVQYLLIRMLTASHRNVCVVGDDDQSIYAFRGATVENILNFKKDFPDAESVYLEQNYRSTGNILSAANAIIAKNATREKKRMRTDNPEGTPIVLYGAQDERDEARFVARQVKQALEEKISAQEIAVFYRTNAQSRAVEEAFCEAGIRYEIFGGLRFYDRKEIKDILSYFRMALNPKDNEGFLRVVNTPTRGLGATAISGLVTFANRRGLCLCEAAAAALAEGASFLNTASTKNFTHFIGLLNEFAGLAVSTQAVLDGPDESRKQRAIAEMLQQIAEKSDYLPRLRAQDTPEAQSRIENIQELCAVAVEFVKSSLEQRETLALREFLDRASLASDLDRDQATARGQQEQASVSMMTLHLAKGLEFNIAFLVGLEEGILPHMRSLDERKALEEERRLCYVGITRAKKQLYLSYALERQTFGASGRWSGHPSRFLNDIPVEVLDQRRSKGGYPVNTRDRGEITIEYDDQEGEATSTFAQRYAANSAVSGRKTVEF